MTKREALERAIESIRHDDTMDAKTWRSVMNWLFAVQGLAPCEEIKAANENEDDTNAAAEEASRRG